jgi:hypothetical protein
MARGVIELTGEDIVCSIPGTNADLRLSGADAAARLEQWAKRYDAATARDSEAELAAIGREMFAWLDDTGWASAWADAAGDRDLEIRMQRRDDAREAALLDAPWELLARDGFPLVLDDMQPFIVARRIAPPGAAREPDYHDIRLMFMAAAPDGPSTLDYEQEEAAILAATRGSGRVHVVVEETGALEVLADRLAAEGPFEAVHLSCHGDIDAKLGPYLLLESDTGGADRAGPGRIAEALGGDPAPLVVLSACRTAEIGRTAAPGKDGRRDAGGSQPEPAQRDAPPLPGTAGAEMTASFARRLATRVANVVGWDGSVYDSDANEFARVFYGKLGRGDSVPWAAAVARRALLLQHNADTRRGRHWHLARVYLGPGGGGPLCAAGKPKRKKLGQVAEKAFLDKERQRVPVAS